MPHAIEEFVTLAPAIWPGANLKVQPGDLSLFAPMGNGLGAPPVMMPWDSLESFESRGAYYALHPHSGHPFAGAPITEAGGGTIYFDDNCQQADIEAMFRLMEVHDLTTDYVAFVEESKSPEDRYLTQMRIMSGGTLQFLFGVPESPEGNAFRQQKFPVGEVIWKFIEHYRNENRNGNYPVEGALGGDGDWARESLAFGFMVENEYHAIYRIWTRAWLVTK